MNRLLWVFVLLISVFFSGCASTYGLKENWIDEDDLQTALSDPNIQNLAPKMGTPVFTEYHGDTVEFVYNYKPHLYKSVRNGREYKPNDKDRVDLWSSRLERVGLLVVGNRVVGIRPRSDYATVENNTSANQSSNWWIILIAVLAAVGVTIAIIAENS